MKYSIGETLDTLPDKVPFGGHQTLFISRGWDVMMKNKPNKWVILDQEPRVKNKGGSYWQRAQSYNKKYNAEGFEFAVRTMEGVLTFFGRYST